MRVTAYRAKDSSLHDNELDQITRDLELALISESKDAKNAEMLKDLFSSPQMRILSRQLMTCIETAPKVFVEVPNILEAAE